MNCWPIQFAAPVWTIMRASEIDAPTVRIRPQESFDSKVFHDRTPMPGHSRAVAANKAGIAGGRPCNVSVSQSADVRPRTMSVLVSAGDIGVGGTGADNDAVP